MNFTDSTNTIFNLAADLVNHTSRHVFITGKAGTGKTTFLKHIIQQQYKNTVVVAPTGVAAINAGGVTMHSFFQLPFIPFVPGVIDRADKHIEAADKHSLFRNIRFSASRRELFQEMECLIIDEVSMVRCDMLDAVDTILRHFRRKPQIPFGGVQVVYIGDLFQLPPVISDADWDILKEHYDVPFFFGAKAVQQSPPLYIELKKIYRQEEQQFIDILNRIRNNVALPEDMDVLNGRWNPGFQPPPEQRYITLTTHNRKADVINDAELRKLPGRLHRFEAKIEGEFSDKAFPTEMNLQLKEGAQIMFIKNDSGNERRYFNGKIAIVKKILNDEITVSFNNGEEDFVLERETWKNVRYHYDREKGTIEEEELGSFGQFPIRLAWAITIHKSQGLTFERAVIDAGASFAPGQVYVALSRCTSLNGLVLHSRLTPAAISTDPRVLAFAEKQPDDGYLESVLREEREKFEANVLIKTFGWEKIVRAMEMWKELISNKRLPDIGDIQELNDQLLGFAIQQSGIAEKFQSQLSQIIAAQDENLVLERVNKAILYFSRQLVEYMVLPLRNHLSSLQHTARVKKYTQELRSIEAMLLNYLQRLNNFRYRNLAFVKYEFSLPEVETQSDTKTAKRVKGGSQRESLELFRQGKSASEIAALRNLAISTVEGHLAGFVYTGEIQVGELVEEEKINAIMKLIDGPTVSASTIKGQLGAEFTFGEIRAVMNYYRLIQEREQTV